MKKAISVFVVLIFLAAASWGVATYMFGTQAEQQYHTLIQQISESKGIKLVSDDYKRGYLASKAYTTFEMQLPDKSKSEGMSKEPLRLTLEHTIKHGPLPFNRDSNGKQEWKPVLAIIETRIPSNPEMQGFLKDAIKEIPELGLMQETAVIYLGGNGEAHLNIPSFQHSLSQAEKTIVDWKGLTGDMTFSAGFKEVKGTMNAPGLKGESDTGSFVMKDIESSLDIHKDATGLNLGNLSFGIAAIQYEDRQKTSTPDAFSFTGFRVKSSSNASGDSLNSTFTMELDRIVADGSQYGPANLDLQFNKIDIPSLLKLQQAMEKMRPDGSLQSQEKIKKEMVTKLAELLPGFIKTSPEVEIKQLSVKTGMGDFQGKAKLTINGSNTGAMNNFLVLLTAISFDAEATATEDLLKSLVKSVIKETILKAGGKGEAESMEPANVEELAADMTGERLNSLVENNILLQEKGSYKINVSYKTGEVVINGRPISLMNFLQ